MGAWASLLAFALGAVLAATLPVLPAWSLWWGLAGLAAAGIGIRSCRIAALFLLGLVWFTGHAQWHLDRAWPEHRAGEVVTVQGQVRGLPESRGFRTRLMLVADRAGRARGVPKRILVEWHRPREYFRPGETWRLELRLDPPAGRLNPGAFDYRRFLLAQRIGATGSVLSAERVAPGGLPRGVDRNRQKVGEWLQATTVNLEAAALHRALTVADRAAMDPELGGLLRRTGTAHLLAISGLHVGMVAGLAGMLAGLLVTPLLALRPGLDRRRIGLAAGLLAALGYAALAGFTLPTQRALVMLAAVAGAYLLRRGIRPGNAVLLALAAVLAVDPLAPLATGFWLSFAAVAVLVWAFAWRPGGSGLAGGLVRAQLLIAVGLLPLNAGIFQQLVPAALAANLVAIPLVGLWVLPCLLIALVLFLAGLPAAWAVGLSERGLVPLLAFLDWLDGLGVGHWTLGGGGWPAIALAMIGAMWLVAPRGWPLRGLGAVLFLPLLVPGQQLPQHGAFRAWVTDMGNGLAVVIRTRSEVVVYDTGPGDGHSWDRIESTLAPVLRADGPERVDRLVVSHARRAHAGGLQAILARYAPAHVYSGSGLGGRPCAAGDGWERDGVRFEFLHPSAALPDLGPDSSCVLRIDSPGASLMLPGGAGAIVQRRLLATGLARPADVVVAPRAGHRDALDSDWLAALQPTWTVISVDPRNRWGLPHPEALARIEATGSETVSTADCGAVRIGADDGRTSEVESMVALERRFWRRRSGCP